MEIKGKLIKILEAEAGTTKAGKAWKSQTCIVDTGAQFNNIVAIKCMNEEKIREMNKLKVGEEVTILCNIYSREYNGKYYNNIDGYWFTNKENAAKKDNGFAVVGEEDLPF